MISYDTVKKLLSYNSITGHLTWLPRKEFDYHDQRWNNRYAGKVAGSWIAGTICWLLHYGSWPEQTIDHIDTNNRNNKPDNWRFATYSQNNANRSIQSNNTTGHKGVYPKRGKWIAKTFLNGKEYFHGSFDTMEEAIEARRIAFEKLYGDFARHK